MNLESYICAHNTVLEFVFRESNTRYNDIVAALKRLSADEV